MKYLVLISFFGLLQIQSAAIANEPTSVSVLAFKNNVGNSSCDQDWFWWRDHLGTAFKDMLISELTKISSVEVLERDNIKEIYDQEVNLINSEKTKEISRGEFKKSKYTFVGSVSSFEYCANKTNGSVSVGALASLAGMGGLAANVLPDVSVGNAKAKVVIDLRLIETKTGRVLKSVTTEGVAARSNYKLSNTIASFGEAKETPAGDAAREAIQKSVDQFKTIL